MNLLKIFLLFVMWTQIIYDHYLFFTKVLDYIIDIYRIMLSKNNILLTNKVYNLIEYKFLHYMFGQKSVTLL